MTARITEWRLSASDLKSDLAASTPIVRTKQASAGAPTGNTEDTVLTTMVRGKLQADSQVSSAASKIQVDVKNGEVTLAGSAPSADAVGRAIALALDTSGVNKVTSNLKVEGQSQTP